MAVFVLDKHQRPLMPCSEKQARLLLERGRAVVHKRFPFAIRLKGGGPPHRLAEDSTLQPIRLKLDPGSRASGVALVRKSVTGTIEQDAGRDETVLLLPELQHRSQPISHHLMSRSALRGNRRYRNTRYRAPRFDNRTRPAGWLPPSLQHRVDTQVAWVRRLLKLAPITAISQELVRFDLQLMQNPEIQGVEYQQGELQGFEVKEYLLEKFGRYCTYCGDMVVATVPTGSKAGTYSGRVAVRATGSFNIQMPTGVVQGISHRHCRLVARADGYGYSLQPRIALPEEGGSERKVA